MLLGTRRVHTGIPFQPSFGKEEARRSVAATPFQVHIVVEAIQQSAAEILFLGDIVETTTKLRLMGKQGTGNTEHKAWTRNKEYENITL